MTPASADTPRPATPAMIVGRSTGGGVPPMGLGEPFALSGGDRLGPAGIPYLLMHEWQPAFLAKVSQACVRQITTGRPWFRMDAALLTGHEGVGRIHAGRSLAHAAGTGHVLLDLSDPAVAASIAKTPEGADALYVSPLVSAMTALRCANPVVSVVNAGCDVEAAIALAMMIDSGTAHSHHERRISAIVDLSEVTWLVHAGQADDLPEFLVDQLDEVEMRHCARHRDTLPLFSLFLEVLRDLDIEPSDPDLCWLQIMDKFPHHGSGWTHTAYGNLRSAVIDLMHERTLQRLSSRPLGGDEDQPF